MSQDPIAAIAEGRRLLAAPPGSFPERRIAVLSSFTADYLPPLLATALQRQSVQARTYLGGFNSWAQEILDPGSALYAFKPEAVLIVTDLQDLFPFWYRDPSLPDAEQKRLVAESLLTFENLLAALRKNAPGASPYLVVPMLDRLPGSAVAGAAQPFRGQRRLEEFLHGLRALEERGAVCLDLDQLARREGAARFRDDRLWYMGRMRLSPAGLQAVAGLFAYHHGLLHTPRAKVVAVDLDGTLWGGVVGEDGWKELELGHETLGLAYREFQEELLKLRAAGLLLAVCSKNEEKTVWEAFEKHPGMVLKKEHLSAWRINWGDKAENVRAIAEELNVGVDSVVFVDDDPVQRAAVASRLPAIVPDLPQDPAARPAFLRALPCLHRRGLTVEDSTRAALYEQRAKREQAAGASGSLEDFLKSLEQTAQIRAVDAAGLPRAAQLCQKTNQFNLTTRRHGEAEIRALLDSGHEAWTLALKDRFGDNGVVALGIIRVNGKEAEIDTLLMSCRVIGRKAELALLAQLCARAKARGAKSLVGLYAPTEKNGQVRDFYTKSGFSPAGEGRFALDLAAKSVPFPEEIRLDGEKSHAAAR